MNIHTRKVTTKNSVRRNIYWTDLSVGPIWEKYYAQTILLDLVCAAAMFSCNLCIEQSLVTKSESRTEITMRSILRTSIWVAMTAESSRIGFLSPAPAQLPPPPLVRPLRRRSKRLDISYITTFLLLKDVSRSRFLSLRIPPLVRCGCTTTRCHFFFYTVGLSGFFQRSGREKIGRIQPGEHENRGSTKESVSIRK